MAETPSHTVLLHGTGGSPESNWLPWLSGELRKQNIPVSVPVFPTPEGQSLDNWLAAFSDQLGELTPNMILVGHSMGAGMILRLLERNSVKIRGAFLVAGWEGLLGLPEFDPLIESFFRVPFDYSRIRDRAGVWKMYHGDDDPYVPLKLAEELARRLGVGLEVVKGGGHLNKASGYVEFARLRDDVLAACE